MNLFILKTDLSGLFILIGLVVVYILYKVLSYNPDKSTGNDNSILNQLRNENISLRDQLLQKDKNFNFFKDQQEKQFYKMREEIKEVAKNEATINFEKWKVEFEKSIRQDAINKSTSVIKGKITEHLIPFFEDFPFNPKEVRFIGSPIDFIVFDGIEDEDADIDIYIVELKTGESGLTKRQKRIKDAIENYNVHWTEMSLKDGKIMHSTPF